MSGGPRAVVVARVAFLGAFGVGIAGCGGPRGVAPPAPGGGHGIASAPVTRLSLVELTAAPDDVVRAGLPAGQLAIIGGLQLSHSGTPQQIGMTAGDDLVTMRDDTLRVWSRKTGLLRWQLTEPGRWLRFAISSNGRRLAVAASEAARPTLLRVLDLEGEQRAVFPIELVGELAFSPDDAALVVVDGGVSVYDVATGEKLASDRRPALAAGFDLAGEVVVLHRDAVRRWSWRSGASSVLRPMPADPDEVALSPDGGVLAWSRGGAVEVVELGGRGRFRQLQMPLGVRSLSVTAGGTVAVGWEGGLEVWDLSASPTKRWESISRGQSSVASAFSRSGLSLAVADLDGIWVRDVQSGKPVLSSTPQTRFIGFAGDGAPILQRGALVTRLELSTGRRQVVPALPGDAPKDMDRYALWSGDGQPEQAVAWNGIQDLLCARLQLWMRGRAAPLEVKPAPRCESQRDRHWFVGAGFVAGQDTDGVAQIWDVADLTVATPRLHLELPARGRPRLTMAFSPDRRWAVSLYGPSAAASDGNAIDVHDLRVPAMGSVVVPARQLEWTGASPLTAAAILGDGRVFAGCADGAVLAAHPGEPLREVARVGNHVVRIEAAPKGHRLAITDEDGVTLLLDGAAPARAE